MTEILSARFLDLADINLSVKLLEKRLKHLFPILVLIWHSSDKYMGSMGSKRVRHDLATEQEQ